MARSQSRPNRADPELLKQEIARLTDENQRLKSLVAEILKMLGARL